MNKNNDLPDVIRCIHTDTVGAMSKRCSIGEIDGNVVYVTIDGQHYIIPISEIQYMIINATDKPQTEDKHTFW